MSFGLLGFKNVRSSGGEERPKGGGGREAHADEYQCYQGLEVTTGGVLLLLLMIYYDYDVHIMRLHTAPVVVKLGSSLGVIGFGHRSFTI